ncbi:MAG: glycosyltransferase, partial [Cyanobacteria bacterium]|nr:glycosyltransferase [Cyanobacteriota bacterium]
YFDEVSFDRGYYDENDLCERAKAKGFIHLVAHQAFAYHKGSKSFGAEKFTLSEKNRALFIKKYPNYDYEVSQFLLANPLKVVQELVYHYLINHEGKKRGKKHVDPPGVVNYLRYVRPKNCEERPSILFLLHHPLRSQMIGGTEFHISHLIQRLKYKYYVLVASIEGDQLILEEFCDAFSGEFAFGVPESLRKKKASQNSSVFPNASKHFDDKTFWSTDIFQEMIFRTFQEFSFRFDLIHIHHVMNNTLDFISLAKAMGKPVLMTLHDYYLVCPSYNLLNVRNQYCGIDDIAFTKCGNCFGNHLPEERQQIQSHLTGVDLAIFPSQSAQSIFEKIYTLKKTIVLPHGIEKGPAFVSEPPSSLSLSQRFQVDSSIESDSNSTNLPAIKPHEPLKLLFLGYVDYQKGIELILKIMDYYHQFGNYANLEFHFLGAIPDPFANALKSMVSTLFLHGTYQQQELTKKLAEIHPHFVCLLSNWPETFSYTLSESLASGYPVIVSPYGALKERVESTGVGYVLPDYSLNGFIKVIHFIQTHPDDYGQLLKRVQAERASISMDEMLQKYDTLYQEYLGPSEHQERVVKPPIASTQQDLLTAHIRDWLGKNLYHYPRQAFHKFKNGQSFAPGLCGISSEEQLKQFSHDPMHPNYQFLWVLPQGRLLGYYGFLVTPDHVL